MSTKAANIAVVDGKRIVEATELQSAQPGKPIRIKAIPNGKYILAEGQQGVAPENITVKRVGKNLHIALEGTDPAQPEVIIEGFFDAQGQLVGVAEDGAYYPYVSSDGEGDAAFLMEGVESAQALGAEPLVGFGNGLYTDSDSGMGLFWPLLLGLGGLGLLGAAYAVGRKEGRDSVDNGGGGGDGDDDDKVTPGKPDTPDLDKVTDNVGDKTGSIESGGTTDDTTPTFTGGGTPGNTIEIIVIGEDGKETIIGEVEVGEDGTWEFTPETPMGEGKHEIIVVEKDPDGNKSDPSEGFELIIDTTAPAKVKITSVTDDQGDETGAITPGTTTDDAQPAIAGTAEPGSTVIIYDGGKEIGRAPVDGSGNWTFTPTPPLLNGSHKITVAAMDAAGNIGLQSDPFEFVVDADGAPDVAAIDDVHDDVGNEKGTIENGGFTDDTTPTLSGANQEPGHIITIRAGEDILGTAEVDIYGNWSFTPNPGLSHGKYEFTITVTDAAGNISERSDPYIVNIDTQAPDQAVLTSVTDSEGDVTGLIGPGTSTDDTHPEFKGTAEPGSTVIIYDGGREIGRAPVDSSGNWTFTPRLPLGTGPHVITVSAMDDAGNIGDPSDPFSFSVGTGGATTESAITGITDGYGELTGELDKGDFTDDLRPTIHGTGQAGSTITVYSNGNPLGTALVGTDGHWSFSPPSDLPHGRNSITAQATDTAGNVGPETGEYLIHVDRLAPDAATSELLTDNVGVTGEIKTGDTTDDATPTFTGKAEPGTTVIIYDKGVEIGRVPVDEAGNWIFESDKLDDGDYSFSTKVQDKAGNQSPFSEAIDFKVDTGAVEISIDKAVDNEGDITGDLSSGSVTNDTTPTLHGKASAGATVYIYNGSERIGSAKADSNGNWKFTVTPALTEDVYNFTATAAKPDGSESAHTAPFKLEIDTTAPGKPGEGGRGGIDSVIDDSGDEQGAIENGGVTDDTTPTLSGGGQQPGDTITIYDGDKVIGERLVDEHGNWEFTPNPALNHGEHSFTIVVTDPAGNASVPSDPYVVNIDLKAPGMPELVNVHDSAGDLTGSISPDGITDDTHPDFSGTAEPNGTVIIYNHGKEIGRAPVDGAGNWTFTPRLPLAIGSYSITVSAQDEVGNEGPQTEPFVFELVAGGAPDMPAITGIEDREGLITGNLSPGDTTDDLRPIIRGTGLSGSIVSVYSNGRLLGTAEVVDGEWILLDPAALDSNEWNNITVKATDEAGNVSPESGEHRIFVDTGRPDVATSQQLYDSEGVTGFIEPGDTTDDDRPTFSGKAEPFTTVIIYRDGEEVKRVPVDEAGNWEYESEHLDDGNYAFSTKVEDKAGNQSDMSAVIDFTVDTSAVEVSIGKAVDDKDPKAGDLAHGDVTDDTTPTLHGKATPNTTVNIYEGIRMIGSAPVDGSGNWKLEVVPALDDGDRDYHFTARVVHPVDGESAPSDTFTLKLDTTAPGKPGEDGRGAIDEIYDSVAEGIGRVEKDGRTNDPQPTLSGGGQAFGDTVTIWNGRNIVGYAPVNTDGTWSFTPDHALAEDRYDFTITVTDEAGNESVHSDPYTIHIDVTGPSAPVIVDATDDRKPSEPIGNGGSTNDVRPQINGTTDIGSKLYIMYGRNGDPWYAPIEVTVNRDGTWSWEPPVDLADGDWEFKAYAVDEAGNKSPESTEFDITVDTVPPVAPTDLEVGRDSVDVSFTSTGLKVGDSLFVKVGSTEVEHKLTAADIGRGSVQVDVPGATVGVRAEGRLVDQTGNSSGTRWVQQSEKVYSFNAEADTYLRTVGAKRKIDGFTLELKNNTSAYYNANGVNYFETGTGSKSIVIEGVMKISLDTPATALSFILSNVQADDGYAGGHIKYYDAAGSVISTKGFPYGWESAISESFDREVSYMEVYSGRLFSGTPDVVLIDDFKVSVTNTGVTPPPSLDIDSSGLHEGTNIGEEFTVDDVSVLNDAQTELHGKEGKDTLTLTGQDQILDLTALGDKVSSMEVIDLTGSGDNTLKLSLDDVLNNGEVDLFYDSETDAAQMMVQGNEGDVVDLQGLIGGEDPGEWTNQGPVTVAGVTYDVYSHSSLEAEILIQQGVNTNTV